MQQKYLIFGLSTIVMHLHMVLEGNASLFTLLLQPNSLQDLRHPSNSTVGLELLHGKGNYEFPTGRWVLAWDAFLDGQGIT
jgi:hypothetical protein